MAEKVYERAPLVEVISEVHWELKQLRSYPDAWIDPYFDLFKDQFLAASKDKLPFVEPLVPNEIPVEFVSNQPHLRLRPKEDGWPLVQIGPGVLTVNVVPPYGGWVRHKSFLSWALKLLWECYPLAEQTLRISQLHLRYVNVFDDTFGLEKYSEFVSSFLGVENPVRQSIVDAVLVENSDVTFAVDSQFQNKAPSGSNGRIRINRGKKNGKDAVVVEFHCDSRAIDNTQDGDSAVGWFDDAHANLHTLFDETISNDLKKTFGKLVEVNQ